MERSRIKRIRTALSSQASRSDNPQPLSYGLKLGGNHNFRRDTWGFEVGGAGLRLVVRPPTIAGAKYDVASQETETLHETENLRKT